MATQAIDYDALFKKNGVQPIAPQIPVTPSDSSAPNNAIDYNALFAKHGVTLLDEAPPPPDPRAQSTIQARTPGVWEMVSGIAREGALGRALHMDSLTPTGRAELGGNPILNFTAAAPQQGAIRGVSKVLSGLTTPENVSIMAATGGLGAVDTLIGKTTLAKLGSLGFSAMQLSNAVNESPAVIDAIKQGDWPKAREIGAEVLTNLLFAYHGARHGSTNEGAIIPNQMLPRTTPAPPVSEMGGRSTLPMPEEMPAAIGKAVTNTGKAVLGAVTAVPPIPSAINKVNNLTKANPQRDLVKAYGTGIDRRIVDAIDETRNDIVTHGGPVETNDDILKFGSIANNKFQAEFDKFKEDATSRGVQYPTDSIIQVTKDAIPYIDEQSAAGTTAKEQATRVLKEAADTYGGRTITTDQIDELRVGLNKKVNNFYKMSKADQNAAIGAGFPIAILKAQRDEIARLQYNGMDPSNPITGATGEKVNNRPSEINRRLGQIKGLMREAGEGKNIFDSQGSSTKLEAIGGVVSGVANVVGTPFHGDLNAAVGKVVHPVSGKSAAYVKRIFKQAGKGEPIPALSPPTEPAYTPPPPIPEPPSTPFKSAEASAQVFANMPPQQIPSSAAESAEALLGPAAVAAQQAKQFADAAGVSTSAGVPSTTQRPPLSTSVPVEDAIARAERLAKEQSQQSLAEKALDQLQREKAKSIQKPVVPETGTPEAVARRQSAREEAAKQLGSVWEELSNQDRNAIDDLIDKGEAGSAKPIVQSGAGIRITTRPPVLNLKKPKPRQ